MGRQIVAWLTAEREWAKVGAVEPEKVKTQLQKA
jgi:hypothetical protein